MIIQCLWRPLAVLQIQVLVCQQLHCHAFSNVVPDLLAALFSQLDIDDDNTAALTSALHGVVQKAVVAALQEVANTIAAAAPLAVTAATPANDVAAAAVQTMTHGGVTYDIPHPSASGPFYWVNRGRHIGVFATW